LPAVIDLFSGCGGLAYGFRTAGFPIGGGVDISESAVFTAAYNLCWRHGDENCHWEADVTRTTAADFIHAIGESGAMVIGGPPCQAYSPAGKGKLRSLGKDRAHTNDSRGLLYYDFLRLVLELDARAVVMENVPESINYGGINVPEDACSVLDSNGYSAKWTILNAADYGVPQIRERMFIIAVKKTESFEPSFPVPTHRSFDGKSGVYSQRIAKLLDSNRYFVAPPEAPEEALPWVTVREALSDLPSLFPTAESRYRLYDHNLVMNYRHGPANAYQATMRSWSGTETMCVSGHGYRRTLRDYAIFERMKPDDNYLDASLIAEELFNEACRAEGITVASHPERYQMLRKAIVPPYDREKFHDKWKRLNGDKPSHTIVAHLSVDTYSHIHPWEPRGISVREAARLQSFPDDFLFPCRMGDAFKQIGNAVPPMLSYAIARQLSQLLLQKELEYVT
jgi:DNA (cytosine-5)-methyltransferase 1